MYVCMYVCITCCGRRGLERRSEGHVEHGQRLVLLGGVPHALPARGGHRRRLPHRGHAGALPVKNVVTTITRLVHHVGSTS